MPLPQEHNSDCIEENLEIHPQRHVFDVKKVILQLFPDVVNAFVVLVLHLCPTGNPGSHFQSSPVEWDFFRELLDEKRAFRPRADETHITAKNVPPLTIDGKQLPHGTQAIFR